MSHPALQAGMRPLVKSEALQVVSYSVGDFYVRGGVSVLCARFGASE